MPIKDLFEANDDEWEVAVRRAEVVRKLVAPGGGSRAPAIAAAATELGVSRPTIYRMISRFELTGRTASLLPMVTGRPRGSKTLDSDVEGIIRARNPILFSPTGAAQAFATHRADR